MDLYGTDFKTTVNEIVDNDWTPPKEYYKTRKRGLKRQRTVILDWARTIVRTFPEKSPEEITHIKKRLENGWNLLNLLDPESDRFDDLSIKYFRVISDLANRRDKLESFVSSEVIQKIYRKEGIS